MGLEVRDEGKASLFLEVGLCDIPEEVSKVVSRSVEVARCW